MKYVSIDVETTGLDPETCDLLEVAAVVDDLSVAANIDELPTFHCYVVKNLYKGEPYALSMHAEIFRRIHNKTPPYNYLGDYSVIPELYKFLIGHFGNNKVSVAGKNFLGLDKPFLSKLPNFHWLKLSHRSLDPGVLYWRPLIDKEVPSSKECMIRAGLSGEVAHNAVDDAKMVIKLIREKTGATPHI
jgi:oligoribonuclease